MLKQQAVRLIGSADAEDAVQDAALRVYRRWNGTQGPAFFRVALRHAAIDCVRRRAARPTTPLFDSHPSQDRTEREALARIELRELGQKLPLTPDGRLLLKNVLTDEWNPATRASDEPRVSKLRRQLRGARAI